MAGLRGGGRVRFYASLALAIVALAAASATGTGAKHGAAASIAATAQSRALRLAPAVCPAAVQLTNASFEQPAVPAGGNAIVDQATVPGWQTTATDGQIEIWSSGFLGVPSADGQQFVELNAFQVSTLYQDVPTIPGTIMNWRIFHRGRDGVDTMQVQIGDPVSALIPQTPTGASSPNISDGNTSWGVYRGSYTVPAGQTTTRFGFASISSVGGGGTGNLLDGILFSTQACLNMTKIVSPAIGVNPGDVLTYTLSVINGDNDASFNTFAVDAIPAGTTLVPSSITRTPPGGSASAVPDAEGFDGSQIRVAVGTSSTPAGGGQVQGNTTWQVSFQVSVNEGEPGPITDAATTPYLKAPGAVVIEEPSNETSTPINTADLAVTKTADPADAKLGQAFDYIVTVTNNGPDDATNVNVTDKVPDAHPYLSDDSGGTYDPATGVWSVGNLANGESKTLHITARADAVGTNVVEGATSDQHEPTPCDPATGCDGTEVTIPAIYSDLDTTKTVDNQRPAVGTTVTFTVTVTNKGKDEAPDVVVTDKLPSGLQYVSSQPSKGSYDQAAGEWSVGSLAVDVTETLTIVARVLSTDTARTRNVVTSMSSGNPDPTPCPAATPAPSALGAFQAVVLQEQVAVGCAFVDLEPQPPLPVTGQLSVLGLTAAGLCAVILGVAALYAVRRRATVRIAAR